jgi:hypothetical protein
VSDRGPLSRLIRVAEEAATDDPRPATFARGLALGALVGAAIAGSTIWPRRQSRRARPGWLPDDSDAADRPENDDRGPNRGS